MKARGVAGWLRPLVLLLLLAWVSGTATAQERRRSKKRYPEQTANTSHQSTDKARAQARQGRMLRIFKRDPSKVLHGNRCVSEYTQAMGFEYVILTADDSGDADLNSFFTNVGNGVVLMFRHGPFWSCKVRKRIRQCRLGTGDFVG